MTMRSICASVDPNPFVPLQTYVPVSSLVTERILRFFLLGRYLGEKRKQIQIAAGDGI